MLLWDNVFLLIKISVILHLRFHLKMQPTLQKNKRHFWIHLFTFHLKKLHIQGVISSRPMWCNLVSIVFIFWNLPWKAQLISAGFVMPLEKSSNQLFLLHFAWPADNIVLPRSCAGQWGQWGQWGQTNTQTGIRKYQKHLHTKYLSMNLTTSY